MRRLLKRDAYNKSNNKKFDGLITQVGVSSKEFWQWFDLMPKHVRDELHNPDNSYERQQELWAKACRMYGREIKARLTQMAE